MAKKTKAAVESLRALDDGRLGREMDDAYRQLFTLRLQVSTRQLTNVKEIGKVRRKIARIKTLQRQRQPAVLGGS